MSVIEHAEFAALMDPLGPFGAAPRIGVAVSGGADSMALACLASAWASARGGTVLALVVDHRLRRESGEEADRTLRTLAANSISGQALVLDGLAHGPALAARARDARLAALTDACAAAGIIDLLLGHHAGDMAETLLMRALSGSAAGGFAGIAAQRETHSLRLLRPLLSVAPARLRATLEAAGVPWVDDPSNLDRRALRGRLRCLRGAEEVATLSAAAAAAGAGRQVDEAARADLLARRASLFPEGYALLTPGPLPPDAFAALLRTISGACYPVAARRVAALALAPRPATIAGVRLLPAGRLGPGLLLVREAQAQAPAVEAATGTVWDGRFRLQSATMAGTTIGALDSDAPRWRRHRQLPAAVLRTLPALRRHGEVVAVPHLRHNNGVHDAPLLQFCPAQPAAGAPWLASRGPENPMDRAY